MPRIRFLFRIDPPSHFGLPEEDRLVYKAEDGVEVYGPTIDSATMEVVGYGTLPRYRDLSEAVRVSGEVNGCQISLNDNFLSLEIESDDYQVALERALSIAYAIVLGVSVPHGTQFTARLIQATNESVAGGQRLPIPRLVTLMRATAYNLDTLARSFVTAIQRVPYIDQTALKALEYFDHAMFLKRVQEEIGDPRSHNHKHLASDIFGNLYKAIAVILGDPKKDRDWQRRYKQFGFTYDFWKTKVERIRQLRNDYDVAHYDLSDRLEQLRNEIGEAERTAAEVIERYLGHLTGDHQAGG